MEHTEFDSIFDDLPQIVSLWEWSEKSRLQYLHEHPFSRRAPWKATYKELQHVYLSKEIQSALSLPPVFGWSELVDRLEAYVLKNRLVMPGPLIRLDKKLQALLPLSEPLVSTLTPKRVVETILGYHGYVMRFERIPHSLPETPVNEVKMEETVQIIPPKRLIKRRFEEDTEDSIQPKSKRGRPPSSKRATISISRNKVGRPRKIGF